MRLCSGRCITSRGVPFQLEAMLRSTLVETSISIFWTVLALTTMLAATRTHARVVWLTGAGLLGVVIAKLFLVDLSHIGTVERIISFVGVGLLMLVIGYFSPLPPAAEPDESQKHASPRMKVFLTLLAATSTLAAGTSQKDFAYRIQVVGTGDAAAYRVALPLAVYQKIAHADLADLRVFNGNGEQVPFALERPVAGMVASAATALSAFPLKDDSGATLDAIRVTIESGKGAINVQTGGQNPPSGRINSYLVDGRALAVPVSALRLEWPQDAADFAGRMRVESSDSLSDWRMLMSGAPIANLRSGAERLVEQRVEFSPTKAKFWRLSWSGTAAPFILTAVLGEPAIQNVDARHTSLSLAAVPTKNAPGEFEYDLGARVPVDRVNLELPDINTVVDVELLSRERSQDPWHFVRRSGFYRLKSEGEELRNGPVSVAPNTDRHWLLRTDPRRGGLGTSAPHLVVEWGPLMRSFSLRAVQDRSTSLMAALLQKVLQCRSPYFQGMWQSFRHRYRARNRRAETPFCNRLPAHFRGRRRCCGQY